MTRESSTVSIVLPAYRASEQLRDVVPEMIAEVEQLGAGLEVIVVVNGPRDGTDEAAETLRASDDRVRVVRSEEAGWGRAVRTGLDAATGDLLAYTNLARTPPSVLRTAVALAFDSSGSVVKASRRVRDSTARRAGSLLYNLECRMLFELSVFDVNGTPKVFPAEFTDLRQLRRDDDLIDIEFLAVCEARNYQVVEFAVPVLPRHSGRSTTNLRSAWHMYSQAFVLRREMRQRGLTPDGDR